MIIRISERLGVRLSVTSVFHCPAIEAMAAVIEPLRQSDVGPVQVNESEMEEGVALNSCWWQAGRWSARSLRRANMSLNVRDSMDDGADVLGMRAGRVSGYGARMVNYVIEHTGAH